MYLQALHKQGLATEDHTTLLLNCYTKLNNTEKLKEFIMVSNWNYSHVTCSRGPQISNKPRSHLPYFGHQKGDTKQVLYRGPLVLEWPMDLIFTYCCPLGVWEPTIFVYKEKNCSNYAEKNWHCQIIFSNLGNQIARICAPMTYSCVKHCVSLNLLPYKLNFMWHNAQYLYYKGVFTSLVFSFMIVTCVFL